MLVLVAFALGVALFFLLILKPSKPEFNLQSANILDFHVDRQQGALNFAVYLSLNITLIFSAINPNKAGIEYSATDLQCFYKKTLLGVAKVPRFYQPAHSHTTLKALVVVDRLNILQAASADLLKDVSVNDKVPLTINGPVYARVRLLGINSPRVEVFVNCQIIVRPQERAVDGKQCNLGQVTLSD